MILFVGNSDAKGIENVRLSYPDIISILDKQQLKNLQTINVGYISICDHSLEDFLSVLEFAQEINYVHSESWDDVNSKIKTEAWLTYLSHKKSVHGLPQSVALPLLDLNDYRKSENPQIWAAGCSFTAGVGVKNHERWAQLVADKLDMPVSFLARDGASIKWASDQILRSNIKKNDTVIWGLTGIGRVSYYNGKEFEFLVNYPSSDGIISNQYLTSSHIFYQALIEIAEVIQRAKDIGFTLVIIMFPFYIQEQETILFQYLSQFNFFIMGYDSKYHGGKFIDYGSDNHHPGPMHNKYWAEMIIKHLDLLE